MSCRLADDTRKEEESDGSSALRGEPGSAAGFDVIGQTTQLCLVVEWAPASGELIESDLDVSAKLGVRVVRLQEPAALRSPLRSRCG